MIYPKIKYYGTLCATFFVLLLSTEHISEALKVVEKFSTRDFGMTWFAAAGLQIFEVLTGMGVADIISRNRKQYLILTLLISILILFFSINVAGNILYAFSNMTETNGRLLTIPKIEELDSLQKFWVFWAAIPIPLMGIAGITVMSIFRIELQKKVEKPNPNKKTVTQKEKKEVEKPKDTTLFEPEFLDNIK
jgi:C4-dicarboxylate transporter